MAGEDLRISASNACGLIQRRHELQMFLDIQKIDICLISETHFTKQAYVKIEGYQTLYDTLAEYS